MIVIVLPELNTAQSSLGMLSMSQPNVAAWFDSLPATQRPVLDALRNLIFETTPDAVEELKWSHPCYSNSEGLFCYLRTTKKHATIGFQKGSSLDDPTGILEGDGKEMRHIKLPSMDAFDESAIKALLLIAGATS